LGNQGVSAQDIPVVAFSVGEEELSGIDTSPLVGHLAAWNYFMSAEADINDEFIEILEGVEEGVVVHLKTPKDGPQQIKDFLKRKTLNQEGPETTAVPANELKTKA